jgi:uncharacterized Zn finger protein (UPF0148 family)
MRLTFALAHFAAEGVAPIFPSKCVTCPFCQGTESARERSEKREARSEKREERREKREERREKREERREKRAR